ncbi:MAG: SDR family oxidoreductase [Thermoplasmata archaeon]
MIAPSPTRADPRVAVVTGATSGIGKEVARGLAAQGWTTVVVGRGTGRASTVAAELATATRNPRVESVMVSDLAVRAEVQTLAGELLDRYPAIHVLVNNAGAYFARREVTVDGLERTFGLNVLAPFTLTSLLADRLRSSAPARVVQVSSSAHRGQSVHLEDLQGSANYHGYSAYGTSKLELILLTREFARRLPGTGVTVNAVHPGFIRSGFGKNNPGAVRVGFRLSEFLFARSVVYGARRVLTVATGPRAGSVSGEYFSRDQVVRGSTNSYDMATARRLFDACRGLAGIPDLPDRSAPEPSGPNSAPARSPSVPG